MKKEHALVICLGLLAIMLTGAEYLLWKDREKMEWGRGYTQETQKHEDKIKEAV